MLVRSGDAYITFDETSLTWEIGTQGISRRMIYDRTLGYSLLSLRNEVTQREWLADETGDNSNLFLGLDGQIADQSSADFVFRGYSTTTNPNGSLELQVQLARGPLLARLYYAVYPSTNLVEQWAEVENSGQTGLDNLTELDSLAIPISPTDDVLTLHWVQGLEPQEVDASNPKQDPILRLRSLTITEGLEKDIGSNSRSSEGSMGWYALDAPSLREGMFGGIEWSGAWQVHVARQGTDTVLESTLEGIPHTLAPGDIFESPRRFVGFYSGDLDDAANASHEFARRYLFRARPENFPWTQFNTWFAYYTNLNEVELRKEVDSAAELGLELFYIDAGWYEGSPSHGDFSFGLGSWRENKDKFPSGLRAFSDYVHKKGLKFGLWVEPERVDVQYVGPGKEVSEEWLAPSTNLHAVPPTGSPLYAQVCLGHPQAREWMKGWLTRIIRDYQLDWIKWDNNVWIPCDPLGATGWGNYEHVRGLYEVLDYLRSEFPNLIIENCASGGYRMDYGLLQRTDVAWLSDQTDPSYRVRYHIYGASYPFPPEYLNSWLVESYFEHLATVETNPALAQSWLRSRMMGAFGMSVSTLGWSKELRAVVAAEIKEYKDYRLIIANGQIYHLLPQPDLVGPNLAPPTEPDAVEFCNPETDQAVVFLFKGNVAWADRHVRVRNLRPTTMYRVASSDGVISMQATGAQLMEQNINLPYAEEHPSTLLLVAPAKPQSSGGSNPP